MDPNTFAELLLRVSPRITKGPMYEIIFFFWVISMISCSNMWTQAAHLHNNGHVNVIILIGCSFWYIRMRRKTFGIILLLGLWFVWSRLRRNNGYFEDRNLKAIFLNKASMYSKFFGKFSLCVWIINSLRPTRWMTLCGRHFPLKARSSCLQCACKVLDMHVWCRASMRRLCPLRHA